MDGRNVARNEECLMEGLMWKSNQYPSTGCDERTIITAEKKTSICLMPNRIDHQQFGKQSA